MKCPCEVRDECLEKVLDLGSDVRVCNMRGYVVWQHSHCRFCLRGRITWLIQKIADLYDLVKL